MICDNLAEIRSQMEQTATRCGRDPGEIKLVAVSKRMSETAITSAQQCGQQIFAENYLQEAQKKIKRLDKNLEWHFIGHLQSNKSRLAAELFQVIQTVDRLKIARALDRHAGELNKTLDILIQVNVGKEPQKSGVLPDKAQELLTTIQPLSNLRVRGLMTMPPYERKPEESRPWFRALTQLSKQFARKQLFDNNNAVELSMGMSGDYKIAIEEGATLIRVGTAIFGQRPNIEEREKNT